MIKIKHSLFGYVKLELQGYSPERFLNLCRSHRLELWDLEHQKGSYQFYMTVKGYRKVRPLVHKSHVRLKMIRKMGIPFFLYRNRKRKLFLLGLSTFFLFLYLLTLFVWDIQFEGNERYTQDTLMKYFDDQNISHGVLKSKVSCPQIEDYLRTDFPEITWVSARISGTRLLVKIKENEVLSTIPANDQSPRNLVAEKEGIITHMIVRSGTPKVSVGDYVEKGQLLVAGEVVITNDSNEVVNVHDVYADADIRAKTSYHYQKTVPLLHRVVVETGKRKTGYILKGFDYSTVILLPSKPDTHWKYTMEETQLKLFDNFYLPFYIGKIKGKEYDIYESFYTTEELKELKNNVHQKFIENLMEKGVHILENNVRMLENESSCYIEGFLTTEESIIAIEQIIKPEETSELDERN